MMDWFRAIDANCERIVPGLWDEPLNMLSNTTFFVILACLWPLYKEHARQRDGADAGILALTGMIAAIPVGSILFHSFAQTWALMADMAPIILFIALYIILFCRRLFGWPMQKALLLLLICVPMALVLPHFYMIPALGLSNFYLPALFMLLYLTAMLIRMQHPAVRTMWLCCGLFALSLTFRTIDKPLCSLWPYGTHFLWHVFNAMLIYMLMQVLLVYGKATAFQIARN